MAVLKNGIEVSNDALLDVYDVLKEEQSSCVFKLAWEKANYQIQIMSDMVNDVGEPASEILKKHGLVNDKFEMPTEYATIILASVDQDLKLVPLDEVTL